MSMFHFYKSRFARLLLLVVMSPNVVNCISSNGISSNESAICD